MTYCRKCGRELYNTRVCINCAEVTDPPKSQQRSEVACSECPDCEELDQLATECEGKLPLGSHCGSSLARIAIIKDCLKKQADRFHKLLDEVGAKNWGITTQGSSEPEKWSEDRVELALANHGSKGLAVIINAELAAEREKLKAYVASVNNADRHNAKWQERAEKAEQQLLQAQAAIVMHNQQEQESTGYLSIISINQSILDAHDKEVYSSGYEAGCVATANKRKLLVDTLERAHQILGALVRALDRGALFMNPSTLLTDIRIAFKKCDDELAKVKQ